MPKPKLLCDETLHGSCWRGAPETLLTSSANAFCASEMAMPSFVCLLSFFDRRGRNEHSLIRSFIGSYRRCHRQRTQPIPDSMGIALGSGHAQNTCSRWSPCLTPRGIGIRNGSLLLRISVHLCSAWFLFCGFNHSWSTCALHGFSSVVLIVLDGV